MPFLFQYENQEFQGFIWPRKQDLEINPHGFAMKQEDLHT
jgi:hypothetical protein